MLRPITKYNLEGATKVLPTADKGTSKESTHEQESYSSKLVRF